MKILAAMGATFWAIMFIAYLFGVYTPDVVVIGFALLYVAVDMALAAFNANREGGL